MPGDNNYTNRTTTMIDADAANRLRLAQITLALRLFNQSRARARLRNLWARLTRKSNRLYTLEDVDRLSRITGRHYAGIQVVAVKDIIGSECRSEDFDSLFNPLHNGNRERWVRMARLYLHCCCLPPVDLLQVGGKYIVRDGHHRVSVARATGQVMIDAEVTVVDTCGILPWDSCPASALSEESAA